MISSWYDMDMFRTRTARFHEWFEKETSLDSQTKTEFLDVLVYKDQNNMLQTKLPLSDQSTRNCGKTAYPTAKLYG